LTGILKWPLKTSDKLLIAILMTFVVKFSLDEVTLIEGTRLYSSIAVLFGMSTIATCGWYIKYITDTKSGFGMRQLAIYSPLVIIGIPLVIFLMHPMPGTAFYLTLAIVTTFLVFYYFWFCIDMLRKHQNLIRENYSGAPGSITIYWMVVIIALQIIEFILKGILARVIAANDPDINIITNEYCFIIMTFLLVVLGIWQKSIPIFIPTIEQISQLALQPEDLRRYQLKIERFMEEHKPYLDPELTIDKLGDLIRMKKLLLSQTLNKAFNKNFFTFIKEYRVRHVEAELKNKNNKGRTILEIAYLSGFNSKSGFHRAFKEVTGKTPTEHLEN